MFNKEEKRALLDQRMRRGEQAKQITQHPLYKESLDAMERDIVRAMKRLRPNDDEGRDVLYRELRCLELFRMKLNSYIQTGEQAKKSLSEKVKEIVR